MKFKILNMTYGDTEGNILYFCSFIFPDSPVTVTLKLKPIIFPTSGLCICGLLSYAQSPLWSQFRCYILREACPDYSH